MFLDVRWTRGVGNCPVALHTSLFFLVYQLVDVKDILQIKHLQDNFLNGFDVD